MAAKQHGTAFVYGVNTTNPTSAQIVSIGLKKSDRNTDKVHNSSGGVISERDDDQLDVITGSLRIEAGFTRLVISNVLVLAGGEFAGSYKITDTDEGKEATGYVTYNFTAEKGEYMTYTADA